MPPEAVDPTLVADFLTEAGELIEQLDADLVRLEDAPGSRDLLDGIFRALHTIKGAASFLNMPSVTTFAHAAEDALNKLRKGEAQVDSEVIDAMLRSVDVLRAMLDQLHTGEQPAAGPQDLIDVLHAIAEGKQGGGHAEPVDTLTDVASAPALSVTAAEPAADGSRPLALPPEKADIVIGMVQELAAFAGALDGASATASGAGVEPAAEAMCGQLASLRPTVDFFGFESLSSLIHALESISTAVEAAAFSARLSAAAMLARKFALALESGLELVWSEADIESMLAGPATSASPEDHDVSAPAAAEAEDRSAEPAATLPAKTARASREPEPAKEAKSESSQGETTVRVEVERLEALLNLVGEMVLTKNQILGVSRQLRGAGLPHELLENVNSAVGSLDRLTSELQVGVMRTRLQPLNKLFGRYPRVVRDLARATGKEIDIEIVGGETEVDKSVLEQLADPMVHILRNSADHGIELPQARVSSGKSGTGTIRVSAAHQGGHVAVVIEDDGKGIDPEIIGRKAVEKGVITEEQAGTMTEQEKINLIFAPGFSTADKVSDLSGRGVGMDVVRTNILKLGGSVGVTSVKGKGTRIEVLIPLTVAIMSAMLVEVGKHQYAVPVASITEIVRMDQAQVGSIAGRPVIRLRESVLPLIDMVHRLGEPERESGRRFAVVVEVGQQRAGLMVDELVGQQEVVIKPLDDVYTVGGPFSGATIREDGDVSLIIDATQLVRSSPGSEAAA